MSEHTFKYINISLSPYIFFAGASNGLPYIRVRVKIEAQVDTVHVQTIVHSSSSEQLSRLDYGLLQSYIYAHPNFSTSTVWREKTSATSHHN